MKRLILLLFLAGCACATMAQAAPATGQQPDVAAPKTSEALPITVDPAAIAKANSQGVQQRVKDIAHFRGVRPNQLTGFGLVVGLEQQGDTKKSPMTQTILTNMLRDFGTTVADPKTIDAKNVALVMVTAELPPFVKPGTQIDVRVSSIGDAKSLQGGVLVQTPLYAAGNHQTAYAVAEGAVSIGGFNVAQGGNSVQKNHVTVGIIPSGAIVETAVPTSVVFNGALYLDLEQEDLTTAHRVADSINDLNPAFCAVAIDGATIAIRLPEGQSTVAAMSRIESATVYADVDAKVVINERTGTIVMGGAIALGPAAIAHGALNIKIESTPIVSQPAPLSNGQTTVVNETAVDAKDEQAKVAVIPPSTTVADLAHILQALQLKPVEIIAILEALHEQGALKARIVQQ